MKKTLLNVVSVFVLIVLTTLKISAQGTYNMCVASGTVTDSTGTLYDSGGPNNDYLVSEDCTLLVAPSCATQITLTFSQFFTESGYDYLTVYDGSTTTGTQLLYTSGNVVPLPGPLVANTGSMLIIWHSDFTVVDSGFAATWTSVIAPSIPPQAAFSVNDATPPLNAEVAFTDHSTGGTTGWYWQFGDGDTAHSQNPSHAYAAPGTYTVTFIPFQCSESDTTTMTITVQGAPQITVNPLSGFSEAVVCGDSVTNTMTIGNIGGGQLLYSTDGSLVGQIKVLAMSYGTDLFVEFPNTIAAINSYFTNYQLTVTSTTNPGTLSGLLVGKNVLLIPEQETNINNNIWPNFGPVIQQFLNNGGSVIFLGSASSLSSNMFTTGIFTGAYASNAAGSNLTIVNGTHPITSTLTGTSFQGPSSTFTMNLTNNDVVTLVSANTSEDVVAYRYYGSGKAIFIAFDYFNTNPSASQIIANAIQWAGENALPTWIHIAPATDTVNAGDSNAVSVTFVANSLPAGTYYANISVNSNDPNTPQISVPCTLTVSGDPIISLSDNCFNFGQVIQHVSVKDTLRISNIGCDTLFINSLTQSLVNSPFTYNATFAYVLPGAFADLVITYSDNNVGPVNDTIWVNNNDTNMWVCLTATSVPAPQLTSSSTVSQPVRACGAGATSTLSISNSGVAGAGDLHFTLGSLPSWVSASPTSGTIPQGQSVQIVFTFNSQTFAASNQTANLTITSNDPQTPNKIVGVTMVVDSNPCISLSVANNTCNGFSTFTTNTINIPTTYNWDFGDGGSSNLQNPVHPYPYNGSFTATCIACNGAGCDTSTIGVQAIITGPAVTNCYPATTGYCCGIGVTQIRIYDNASPPNIYIDNTTNDAVDGYKDYTCSDTATLLTTVPYNIFIVTGQAFSERVRVFLDMNADTHLDSISELIFDNTGTYNHAGTFTLPDYPTNVFGQPLRMRVMSDYQESNGTGNPTANPCTDLLFGQAEDYSIFLSGILSAHSLETETAFSVYPNPFENSTTIDYMLQNASKVSVEIFNVVGEKVAAPVLSEMQSAGRHSYTFSNQPAGIYFVKLFVNGKTVTKKIIKM